MNIVFIINPEAGKGKGKKLIPIIHEIIKEKNIDYQIKETSKKGDATVLAREAIKENAKKVIAVGGDGTINEVINGLITCNIDFGIIPAGSGNDVAKLLKLPKKTEDALELAIDGKSKMIDLGRVYNRYFINIASIGLDAEIAAWTKVSKKVFSGKWAYIASILRNICTYRSIPLEIIIDGKEIKKDILLSAVGNGKYYGGGLKILPKASMDDGYFDICIVSNIPKWKLFFVFPSLFKGNHGKYNFVEFTRAKKVEIKTKENVKINLDGEIEEGNNFEFEIVPKALNIIGS